jgi:hypothetical protein
MRARLGPVTTVLLLRLAIVTTVLLLAGAGASSFARPDATRSAQAAAARCGPSSARTLAAGASARVYASHGKVYGCSIHGHASYVLGSTNVCTVSARVGAVAVTAELAAYGLERCGVDTGSSLLIVRRLTDGHQIRSASATKASLPEAFQIVSAVALRSNGAVAWIGTIHSVVGGRTSVEVHMITSSGTRSMVDSGSSIEPTSLRLHGSRLTWRHGKATRSATLS